MLTILDVKFGREFFGWPETLGKQGWKFRYQNSPSKFAENFARNFPKNSPDQNKKFTPNPLCITWGPRNRGGGKRTEVRGVGNCFPSGVCSSLVLIFKFREAERIIEFDTFWKGFSELKNTFGENFRPSDNINGATQPATLAANICPPMLLSKQFLMRAVEQPPSTHDCAENMLLQS